MQAVARLDRRKAESRQRLLMAARLLFIARGYHDTRPQDIAREADVGHGTFYLHFADKRDCFLAFADQARQELEIFLRPRLEVAEGVEAQIRATLTGVLDYAERNPGVLKAALTDLTIIAADEAPVESLADRWAAAWAERLRAATARGAIHGDYDVAVVGQAVLGAIQGAVRHRGGTDRDVLIDNLTRFLTRALVPNALANVTSGKQDR